MNHVGKQFWDFVANNRNATFAPNRNKRQGQGIIAGQYDKIFRAIFGHFIDNFHHLIQRTRSFFDRDNGRHFSGNSHNNLRRNIGSGSARTKAWTLAPANPDIYPFLDSLFAEFLNLSAKRGLSLLPLAELLPKTRSLPGSEIEPRDFPGREGWIACQKASPAFPRNHA